MVIQLLLYLSMFIFKCAYSVTLLTPKDSGRYDYFQIVSQKPQIALNMGRYPVGFPLIGHYAEIYQMHSRLALIELDQHRITQVLPSVAQNKLAGLLGINISELQDNLNKKNSAFNTIICGGYEINSNASFAYDNLVYHAWRGAKHLVPVSHGATINYFNENIYIGIFGAQGVSVTDLKINDFVSINVNWHDPSAISPDNAHVVFDKNQDFISFWAIAVSMDKNDISITLFLIAQSPLAQDLIMEILKKSRTIRDVMQAINSIKEFNVLYDWITIVTKAVTPVTSEPSNLGTLLSDFYHELTALAALM